MTGRIVERVIGGINDMVSPDNAPKLIAVLGQLNLVTVGIVLPPDVLEITAKAAVDCLVSEEIRARGCAVKV